MFNGNANTSFKTEKPKKDVLSDIESQLESLGTVDMNDNGSFKINASKFSNFTHDSTMEGTVREKDGKYNIDISFTAKPNMVCWILAICTIIGILALILPIMAKSEMQKTVDNVLTQIKRDYKV